MIIIIDGYNLLRAMFPKVKGRLDRQREMLIKTLGIYQSKKNNKIVLVFDGGLIANASREITKGVVVIFSGRGRSADDYIVEYCNKNMGKELLLITNDNELKGRCRRFNVDSLSVNDFEDIIGHALIDNIDPDNTISFEKYDNKNESLDILMEQAAMESYNKDDSDSRSLRRSKSYTKSKAEKRMERKIKKL